MEELTNRFSLEAIKFNSFVLIVMVLIWMAVLAGTISSILSQPFSKRQKMFWLIFVIALPPIGVLAYLPFSFNKEDLPDLLFGRGHHKKSRRSKPKARRLPDVRK